MSPEDYITLTGTFNCQRLYSIANGDNVRRFKKPAIPIR